MKTTLGIIMAGARRLRLRDIRQQIRQRYGVAPSRILVPPRGRSFTSYDYAGGELKVAAQYAAGEVSR